MDELKERIDNICKVHFKKGVEDLLLHKDYSTLVEVVAFIRNPDDFTNEVISHVNNFMQKEKKEVG